MQPITLEAAGHMIGESLVLSYLGIMDPIVALTWLSIASLLSESMFLAGTTTLPLALVIKATSRERSDDPSIHNEAVACGECWPAVERARMHRYDSGSLDIIAPVKPSVSLAIRVAGEPGVPSSLLTEGRVDPSWGSSCARFKVKDGGWRIKQGRGRRT